MATCGKEKMPLLLRCWMRVSESLNAKLSPMKGDFPKMTCLPFPICHTVHRIMRWIELKKFF
jgi:hypothetical protein